MNFKEKALLVACEERINLLEERLERTESAMRELRAAKGPKPKWLRTLDGETHEEQATN